MLDVRRDIAALSERVRVPRWDVYRLAVEMLLWARFSERLPPDLGDLNAELTPSRWRQISRLVPEMLGQHELAQHAETKDETDLVAEIARRTLLPHLEQCRHGETKQVAENMREMLFNLDGEIGYTHTPPYVFCELLRSLAQNGGHTAIYAPFDTTGIVALHLASAHMPVAAEIKNLKLARFVWALTTLGGWELEVRVGDPVPRPNWANKTRLDQFAQSVAVLQSGLRPEMEQYDPFDRFPIKAFLGETYQLAHLLAQTEGRAIVVAPESLLFRTTGGERDLKEMLVRRGWLKMVVRLPRADYGQRSTASISILVFDKMSSQPDVLFVDSTERLLGAPYNELRGRAWAEHRLRHLIDNLAAPTLGEEPHKRASADDIAENEFNLSVERYVLGAAERKAMQRLQGREIVPLEAIADFIRPQVVRDAAGPDSIAGVDEFLEVGLSDVKADGSLAKPKKSISVSRDNYSRAKRQILHSGDVLLSIRGSIGRVALFESEAAMQSPCVASQAFVIIRLRPNTLVSDPTILLRYFASPHGQALVSNLAGGAGVPMVPMNDLRKLPIMLPSLDEIAAIREGRKKAHLLQHSIDAAEAELKAMNETLWPMS